jgi:hypothetical protein
MQNILESFPAEYGAGGRTVWAVGVLSDEDHTVAINFTEAAMQAGGVQAEVDAPLPAAGWAYGDFELQKAGTVLFRCDTYFRLDSMQPV